MSRLVVKAYTISVDGYGAGPAQSLEHPLGRGGEGLHPWMLATRSFHRMYGREEGSEGVDDGFVTRSFDHVGAWILGRNMFGPVRGPWPDDSWKGWWGEERPYHVPVFVLTHHARPPLEMLGGTVFHFVTGGVEAALDAARAAVGDKDIRVGGGASTVRQYLAARLIDELHIAVAPVLLGSGEPLFAGMDWAALGYQVAEQVTGEKAVHLLIRRSG